MSGRRFLITCEHAGNKIPESYNYLFKGKEEVLKSHRGWDPGASQLACHLGSIMEVPVFMHPTSRLLVEVNRSLTNPQLFSEFTSTLDPDIKKFLLDKYYHPYRKTVYEWVKKTVEDHKEVVHISMHTFTPVWQGKKRKTDIGILFDEKRRLESKVALTLKNQLHQLAPLLQVDCNEPYKGTDDGLTTALRKKFGAKAYSGIEIEVNQKFFFNKELDSIQYLLNRAFKEFV